MQRRNVYVSYGFGEPEQGRRVQANSRDIREARAREEFMRQQQLRQRQQQQQQQAHPPSSGGFGYFLAAIVGVAAGFIAKAFFDEDDQKNTKTTRGNDRENIQNTAYQYEPTGNPDEAGDPIDSQLEDCNDIVCPITLEVMSDPVISKKCGHSFEGHAIVAWLKSKNYCPKCHAPLQRTDLVKNFSLKNAIDYMRKQAKTEK